MNGSDPYDNAAKPNDRSMMIDFEFTLTPLEVREEKRRREAVIAEQNKRDAIHIAAQERKKKAVKPDDEREDFLY